METTWVDVVIKIISSLGFPIFVAIWLLIRDWKQTSKLTESLDSLKTVIQKLCDSLDNNKQP